MVINVTQTFQTKSEGFTLDQLINVAFASSEDPGEDYCGTAYSYGGFLYECINNPGVVQGDEWGEAWCYGTAGSCMSGSYYYTYACDGTKVGSDDMSPSTCS